MFSDFKIMTNRDCTIAQFKNFDDLSEYILALEDNERQNSAIVPYGKNNEKFILYVNKKSVTKSHETIMTADDFKAILNEPKAGQDGPSFRFNRLMSIDDSVGGQSLNFDRQGNCLNCGKLCVGGEFRNIILTTGEVYDVCEDCHDIAYDDAYTGFIGKKGMSAY